MNKHINMQIEGIVKLHRIFLQGVSIVSCKDIGENCNKNRFMYIVLNKFIRSVFIQRNEHMV